MTRLCGTVDFDVALLSPRARYQIRAAAGAFRLRRKRPCSMHWVHVRESQVVKVIPNPPHYSVSHNNTVDLAYKRPEGIFWRCIIAVKLASLLLD